MLIGPKGDKKKTYAYKPGRAKLLAIYKGQGPRSASENNDSLVYYAVAAYMTSIYDNTYPAKPRAWNPELSREDNEENNTQPVFDDAPALADLEGNTRDDAAEAVELNKDSLFPASVYPDDDIIKYGVPGENKGPRLVFTGTATPVETGGVTADEPPPTALPAI